MAHRFADQALFLVSPACVINGHEFPAESQWIRKWEKMQPDQYWLRTCESAVVASSFKKDEVSPTQTVLTPYLIGFWETREKELGTVEGGVEDGADLLDSRLEAIGAIPVPEGLWRNEEAMRALWNSPDLFSRT